MTGREAPPVILYMPYNMAEEKSRRIPAPVKRFYLKRPGTRMVIRLFEDATRQPREVVCACLRVIFFQTLDWNVEMNVSVIDQSNFHTSFHEIYGLPSLS